MDINKLSEAASVFIGRKDFKSFMAAGGKISDTVRTVIKSEIVQPVSYKHLDVYKRQG